MTDNANEIAKFSQDEHAWWGTDGMFRTLHHINPARLDFIEQHIALKDMNAIDVGCGGGILAEALAKRGAVVTGVDLSAQALDVARAHALKNQLKINYQLDEIAVVADKFPQSFDVVTCLEMLEHVDDPAAIIAACSKLVKPDGHVFFSTLNRTLKAYALAVIGAEYILNLIPKKTHDYAKFIRPSELEAMCAKESLKLKTIKGLAYNPLTKNAWVNDDLAINYIVYCRAQA